MGHNGYGRLGDGTTAIRREPVKVVDANVTTISAGESHCLFLKTEGSLWGMGMASAGQLGNLNSSSQMVPIKMVDANVTAYAGGFRHTAYVKSDGQ